MRLTGLAAGAYVIWIDSRTDTNFGDFNLQVSLEPPTPPPANDACATAQALVFGPDETARADGTTLVASNEPANPDGGLVPSCNTTARTSGRDVWYRYNLPTTTNVAVAVAPRATNATTLRTVLSEQDACLGAQLTCSAVATGGKLNLVSAANRPPGDYWVGVDTASTVDGDFRVFARRGAAPNDTCASATPVLLSTPGQDNSILDVTRFATDDYGKATGKVPYVAPCDTYSSAGPDLVYAFTSPITGTVSVRVEADPDYDVALHWLQGSCAPASCTRSDDSGSSGTTEELNAIPVTQGTTYWIVVDGYTATEDGAFRLTVSSP
jgi:hypothetical protein